MNLWLKKLTSDSASQESLQLTTCVLAAIKVSTHTTQVKQVAATNAFKMECAMEETTSELWKGIGEAIT